MGAITHWGVGKPCLRKSGHTDLGKEKCPFSKQLDNKNHSIVIYK